MEQIKIDIEKGEANLHLVNNHIGNVNKTVNFVKCFFAKQSKPKQA